MDSEPDNYDNTSEELVEIDSEEFESVDKNAKGRTTQQLLPAFELRVVVQDAPAKGTPPSE